jgi:hypothetical protein
MKFLFNVSPYGHELDHWIEGECNWRKLDTEIMQVALHKEVCSHRQYMDDQVVKSDK